MNIIDNKLYVGELKISDIADKYPTPFYLYDEEVIRFKYKELADSLRYPNTRIFYAAKANTNKRILEILREEGAGIDAVSPGEIMAALDAGFKPSEIMFTATAVTDEEMNFAVKKRVLLNIDSVSQLERYGKLNPRTKVCLRINPRVGAGHHDHVITGGPDSKFGIWVGDLEQAIAVANKYGLVIAGLHQHIGSGILDVDKFINAMDILLAAARNFKTLEFIDFGGGLGVPYSPDQSQIDIEQFGIKVSKLMHKFSESFGKQVLFIFEPGRYLVAEAGALICTVNTIKSTPSHKFVGVNTGFNHLIRPMAYGSYHEIVNVNDVESKLTEKVAIYGNICETGDVFTHSSTGIDRQMPVLKEGDILAIRNVGAYGFSMSSNYNTRPKPAEILVSEKKITVIRPAQKLTDLIG